MFAWSGCHGDQKEPISFVCQEAKKILRFGNINTHLYWRMVTVILKKYAAIYGKNTISIHYMCCLIKMVAMVTVFNNYLIVWICILWFYAMNLNIDKIVSIIRGGIIHSGTKAVKHYIYSKPFVTMATRINIMWKLYLPYKWHCGIDHPWTFDVLIF